MKDEVVAGVRESRLDDFMPEWTVRSAHWTVIDAPPAQVYRALQNVDFSESRVISTLIALRGLGRRRRALPSQSLTERIVAGGFMLLAEVEPHEVVLGIVGRFWRPLGNIAKTVRPEDFTKFTTPGYAKAAWNFSLRSLDGKTELHTQTRVTTFGAWATFAFRCYWFVVGSFSGWIRNEMLRLVKEKAEG